MTEDDIDYNLLQRSTSFQLNNVTIPTSLNSKAASAIFVSHRLKMEEVYRSKANKLAELPNSEDLLISPDPNTLMEEFKINSNLLNNQDIVVSGKDAFIPRLNNTPSTTPVLKAATLGMLDSTSFSIRASTELNDLINEFEQDTWCYKVFRFIEKFSRRALFLCILGLITGLFTVLINFFILKLNISGLSLAYNGTWGEGFFSYIGYNSFLIMISSLLTYYIAPVAAGSGIPEMKSILSGAKLPEYLSIKTLFVKCVALTFAVGGNLTVGQEGPFVHISSAISSSLLNLPWFEKLGATDHSRSLYLGIGCGVGIAAGFGAPFGGMLYAIEVTSTYYSMDNYFASFLACVFGAFTFRWLWNIINSYDYWVSVLKTDYVSLQTLTSFGDLFLFAILGIFISGLSYLLIKLFAATASWRRKHTSVNTSFSLNWHESLSVFFANGVIFTAFIIILTSILNYPRAIGDFMGISSHDALESLFVDQPIDQFGGDNKVHWATGGGHFFNLLLFGSIRLFLCSLSMVVPVPCGMFLPSMLIGASFGRFWGEVCLLLFKTTVSPGVFAVAGSAAMVAGVTHSLSTVLILFEMTGQLSFSIHVTICTLASLILSKKFTSSIYETIIEARKLPYLPTLKDHSLGGCIANIMEPCSFRGVIPMICSVSNMIRLLTKMTDAVFPVTLSKENLFFVGSIKRSQLEKYVVEALESGLKEIDSASSSDFVKLQEQRELLSKIMKTVLDPMHRHVVVRPDFDLESLLLPLEKFGRLVSIQYDSAPVRMLPETSIVHAHILFILFRLQYGFVCNKGQLCGVVRRVDFVKAIRDPDSYR